MMKVSFSFGSLYHNLSFYRTNFQGERHLQHFRIPFNIHDLGLKSHKFDMGPTTY